MWHQFLNTIGWRYLTDGDMVMIGLLGGAVAMILAFVADLILDKRSYGMIGNMIILVFGAVLGLFLLTVVEYAPTRRIYMHAVFGCILSACLMLTAAAAAKRAI